MKLENKFVFSRISLSGALKSASSNIFTDSNFLSSWHAHHRDTALASGATISIGAAACSKKLSKTC